MVNDKQEVEKILKRNVYNLKNGINSVENKPNGDFDSKKIQENVLNNGLIEFIIFHFLMFMLILSMILIVVKNPGTIGNSYVNV